MSITFIKLYVETLMMISSPPIDPASRPLRSLRFSTLAEVVVQLAVAAAAVVAA
jgi:hypothetical protein